MIPFWKSRGRDPSKGRVTATAVVTIKMHGLGVWGADYKLDQIIEQARDTVEERIRQYGQKNSDHITILDTKITAVFAEEDQ